jgi:hypothetical protein
LVFNNFSIFSLTDDLFEARPTKSLVGNLSLDYDAPKSCTSIAFKTFASRFIAPAAVIDLLDKTFTSKQRCFITIQSRPLELAHRVLLAFFSCKKVVDFKIPPGC